MPAIDLHDSTIYYEETETGTPIVFIHGNPTLAEVADFAAFVASDRASAMTGTIANVICGYIVD